MTDLFDMTRINGMTLANRFVRSATWEGMAHDDGAVRRSRAKASVVSRNSEKKGNNGPGGRAMHRRPAIIVMVKYPRPGRVKTRLGRQIGMDTACALYREFVRMLLAICRASGYEVVISCDSDHPLSDYQAWLGTGFQYMGQRGADLGQKMRDAFEQGFALGNDPIVLIGSDLPHLPGDVIDKAAQQAETVDVVIGPALDGGYYLVAMTKERFYPGMFDDIPWSTAEVLSITLEKLSAGRRSPCMLTPLRDIDTLADLRAVAAQTGWVFSV